MRNRLITGILVVLVTALFAGCGNSPEVQAEKQGEEIWFGEQLYEYGDIAKNSDGACSFTFTNIGDEAIVISQVRASCGCTVPSWPKEPVEPGDSGMIRVVYNTAISGPFYKSINVYSTAANSPVKLYVKGKVIPAA
ncbi:MAG: DUF1573 domain-containing protein, partial [Bacteroidota bacterium]